MTYIKLQSFWKKRPFVWIHKLALFGFWTGFNPAFGISSLLVHIAWLHNPGWPVQQWPTVLSFHLFFQTMYMLDRVKEAQTNIGSLNITKIIQPSGFVRCYPKAFRLGLLGIITVQLICAWSQPYILFAALGSLGISLPYFLTLPGLNIRVKDLPFFKNIYSAAAVLLNTYLFFAFWPKGEALLFSCFVFVFYICNANIYDLKDVKDDRKNNIKTFANSLSLKHFLLFELMLVLALGAYAWFLLPSLQWIVWWALLSALFCLAILTHRKFELNLAIWLDLLMSGPFMLHELTLFFG